ncbi:hypothetical protein CC79DRAFT_1330787 [Sarocladium strictum]
MSSKAFFLYRAIVSSGSVVSALSAQPWPDSTIHSILLPSDPPPMDPEDSFECVFENVTQYYDPPKPKGALLDTLFDYGDAMFQACDEATEATEATGADHYDCYPEKDEWCKFNTERPDKLSDDLSAWGSTVSSWWAEHSSKAEEVAVDCPQYWFDAGAESLDMRNWLNKIVIFAGRGVDSPPGADTTTTREVLMGTTTTGTESGEETSAVPTSKTQPDQDDAGPRRMGREEMWKLAGVGVVAAVVIAVL